MSCGVIKQCTAITKHKCQCKNHVTNNSEFCDRHSKMEARPQVASAPSFTNCNFTGNTALYGGVINAVQVKNETVMNIPENIFVNGKFVPNVNKVQVEFKKPARGNGF